KQPEIQYRAKCEFTMIYHPAHEVRRGLRPAAPQRGNVLLAGHSQTHDPPRRKEDVSDRGDHPQPTRDRAARDSLWPCDRPSRCAHGPFIKRIFLLGLEVLKKA